MKNTDRSNSAAQNRRNKESGFVLIVFALLLTVILLYGGVVLGAARNNKQRTLMHAMLFSTLQAAMNTGPNPVSFFESACNTVAALRFSGSAALTCDPIADFPAPASPTQPRVATYNGVVSADGDITCQNIQFTYTSAQISTVAGEPNTPPQFCVQLNCADSALSFLGTTISSVGSTSCIEGANAVGYLAIDYSNSLHNIYQDLPQLGTEFGKKIPPSFVTLNNDLYFSQTETPQEAAFYSTADGATTYNGVNCEGCLGLPPQGVLQQLIDLQPVGIREFLDPNTGGLIQPINPPFATKEIDRKIGSFPATSFNTLSPEVDNPDGLELNVLLSLPQLVDLNSSANGSDGVPDPIQYLGPEPVIDRDSSPMRRWVAPEVRGFIHIPQGNSPLIDLEYIPALMIDPPPMPTDLFRIRSYARAGHLTQNTLTNRCFGVFLHIYKQAAQQVLYIMANYGFRIGVMGFSNWLLPILPLYPQQFFELNDGSNPFFNKKITDLPLGGPPVSSQPTSLPGGDIDYIQKQFGDISESNPLITVSQQTAVGLVQGASLCAGFLNHDIGADPPMDMLVDNSYKPYRALSNPYDSSMPVVPPALTPVTNVHYNFPLVFGADGLCYRNADPNYNSITNCEDDDVYQHSCGYSCQSGVQLITHLCSDPGLFKGSLENNCPLGQNGADESFFKSGQSFESELFPSAVLNTPALYLQTGTPPNLSPSDIVFPYRWSPSNPPNLAVAIQSLPSGPYSKNGYQKIGDPDPPATGNALTDPLFPYTTEVGNTFTAGAVLLAKRALEDPALTTTNDKKIMVVVTDGEPNVSVWRTIQEVNSDGDSIYSNQWHAPPPAPSELPNYYPPGSGPEGNDISSLLETLHILHSFVDADPTNRKVILVFIASDVVGPNKDALLAGLRAPNASPGDDPANPNPNAYNFCKSQHILNHTDPAIGLNFDGEQVVTAQTCDPDGDLPKEFTVIDLVKQSGETYNAYRLRILLELSAQLQKVFNVFSFSK